ncbi:methionine S-methyltransferase [Wolffia australiana]
MVIAEVEEFLRECERSGDAAYVAFKLLLERLDDPFTRSAARVFLAKLQSRFDDKEAADECFRTYHFRIHDVFLAVCEGYDKREKLTLLEIPSIFIPEDWSFTFYEGINRHPESIFKEKTVAELGCGNGWISIALAAKWLPSKVYGLDINPRAIKVAWINLYLNALDENGNYIYDQERKTLLDRVEFHESDLLGYCRDNKMELDRIVGCIPQILNPNPEAMSKMITENASEEFLYSLSNYCALQGFVEDQFGLGLIARAVEEGISIIKPMGFMIFNIGGRPGQGVCRRLFERRGFRITKLWQTKVLQAADTDISALVEIEKNSPHRFEFFMGLVGDQPICARTALAYVRSGGRISHSLSVFSCQLRHPSQVKTIFDFLKNDGFKEISSSLDLSFEDEAVAEEKIPFLAHLAGFLKNSSFLPVEPPAGNVRFRNLIAGFLKMYHHIPLTSENVVVFPSRAAAIENVLRLFLPPLAIVDENLTKQLPKHWLTSSGAEVARDGEMTVIEAPRQSDLMIELIKRLRPQVVVTGMASFEAITSSAFEHLLSATRLVGARLFLDLSDHLELSSLPPSNGVLNFLASHVLPPHAALLCGLLKNQVYSDLEVAFVISEEVSTVNALAKTVELLAGQTPLLSQFYYGCLLRELLAFQIPDRHPSPLREAAAASPPETISLAGTVASVFARAEPPTNQSLLPVPAMVRAAVFEGFARQNVAEPEADVRPGILSLLRRTLGLAITPEFFFSGDTPLSLFSRLAFFCARSGGTLCFPAGSPGNYASAAKLLGAATVVIPTHPDEGFKLTAPALSDALRHIINPWIYLSAPTSAPAGSVYTRCQIRSLVAASAAAGARVLVLDSSFSGLEFGKEEEEEEEGAENWGLGQKDGEFAVVVLGGLSLELLTGGLDFGYLVLDNSVLGETFASFYQGLSKPHSTLRYALRKLLALKAAPSGPLQTAVLQQKSLLRRRSDRLTQVLRECGWEVDPNAGGMTLVARPTAYLGRTMTLEGSPVVVDEDSVSDMLVQTTGLRVNSGTWTGLPGYCSFSLALQDDCFDQVLLALCNFHQILLT